jgi:hypothetical protein
VIGIFLPAILDRAVKVQVHFLRAIPRVKRLQYGGSRPIYSLWCRARISERASSLSLNAVK